LAHPRELARRRSASPARSRRAPDRLAAGFHPANGHSMERIGRVLPVNGRCSRSRDRGPDPMVTGESVMRAPGGRATRRARGGRGSVGCPAREGAMSRRARWVLALAAASAARGEDVRAEPTETPRAIEEAREVAEGLVAAADAW